MFSAFELSKVCLGHEEAVREKGEGWKCPPCPTQSDLRLGNENCSAEEGGLQIPSLPIAVNVPVRAAAPPAPLVPASASINFKKLSGCSCSKMFLSLLLPRALCLSVSSCHISRINVMPSQSGFVLRSFSPSISSALHVFPGGSSQCGCR